MEDRCFSPYEEDRLRASITALPTLSLNISDSARHEKLLTFFKSCFKNKSCAQWIIGNLRAFQIIESCLEHPDTRVVSLGIRFFGSLVDANSESFLEAKKQHPQILVHIRNVLINQHSHPQLVFACLEALRDLLSSSDGVQWMLDTVTLPSAITVSLLSPSHFIVSEASKLLLAIIDARATSSFPRSQISNISSTIVLPILESLRLWLINPLTPAHLFAATEALACICAAPSAASFETLCTPDLFPQFAQSILTTDRLIWFRVLEAMKTALRWVEDPALLVTGIKYRESREESFARAFAFFWCALESVQSAAGAAGVKEDYLYGLLDIMAILAGRSKIHTLNLWMVSVILQMLHQFGFNCRPIKIPVLPWQDEQNGGEKWHGFPSEVGPLSSLSKILISLENCLEVLHLPSAEDIHVESLQIELDATDFTQVFRGCESAMLFILTETSYRSSQRLAQTALGCVGKLARRAQGSKDREQLALILIDFAATQTAHPQHITYVLEFLSRSISESDEDSLFAAESSLSFRLGTLLVATLLKHPLWNVRDTAADFIGQFFLAPMCNHAAALTFAVRHDLPKHLLALCDDEQAFVRSTCLVAVRRVISHPRGFIYLDAHGLLPQVCSHLQYTSLSDAESFVRRSAVEVVRDLVAGSSDDEECWKLASSLLNANLLFEILHDSDDDVRTRGVQLLKEIWNTTVDAVESSNRSKAEWFFDLKADQLVLIAVGDASRLTRTEVLLFLQSLQAENSTAGANPMKRTHPNYAPVEDFIHRITREVDLPTLSLSTIAEHMYQEVLHVDDSVIQEHEGLGEGNNILECYDC